MKLTTTDIGQMASASDVIFQALHRAITQGDLSEGEVLRQDAIARLFNVSRIPVREALARLEEQGLVTTQRYKGAVVSSLSIQEIQEIFDFRAMIEPEVIRHSVANISAQALADATSCCEAFSSEIDPIRWGELNRKFHFSLYNSAGRPYYIQVCTAALDRVDRYIRAQLVLTDGMARARVEHRAILQACIDRDADRAAEHTRRHIIGAGESLIAFLRQQPVGAGR